MKSFSQLDAAKTSEWAQYTYFTVGIRGTFRATSFVVSSVWHGLTCGPAN